MVVAAPHEGFDLRTALVASAAAEVLTAGLVIADGFRNHEHPVNVNRPTEGIGLPADHERRTARAMATYIAYLEQLQQAAVGEVAILIEIHGNSRSASSQSIEVATVGVDLAHGERLRTILQSTFAANILVEPLDTIHYDASAAKAIGSLSQVPMALHLELPAMLRAHELAIATGRRIGWAVSRWLSERPLAG